MAEHVAVEKDASGAQASVSDWHSDGRQAALNKLARVLLCLLVVYAIVRGLAGAVTTGFWFDEIITSSISAQPDMRAVWAALSSGVDGQPPGFYVVERASAAVIRNRHIAMRMPSILAFACTLVCVFFYMRRRGGEAIAFLCALLLLTTILYERYATEARPYALVVACFAFALLCYQRVPAFWWTVLLGISLALAQSFHHYSIFAMAPFGLAEAVMFFRARKFRWGVWLALAIGACPLLFFWPLLVRLKAYVGAHYQEQYTLTAVPSTYGTFFLVDSGYGAAIGAICLAGVILVLLWRGREATAARERRNWDVAEGTLLLSLVGLPFIAFCVVKVMHGGLRGTYVIEAILGLCLALGLVLTRVRPLTVGLFAVFLLFDVGLREYKFWQSARTLRFENPAADFEKFLDEAGSGDNSLPVVVANGLVYVPLAYYGSAAVVKRIFYLTDEEKELHYQGTDTFDKNVKLLQNYTPLQIRDYTTFTAEHPVFLLYGVDPGYGNSWLAEHLSREGYSVQALAVDPIHRLFLVNMSVKAPRGDVGQRDADGSGVRVGAEDTR
jgi:hypothetical protein